jgi:hypothetical protein
MSIITLDEPIRVVTGAGPVVQNTTTVTSIINPEDQVKLRAGWFRFVGRTIKIRASGVASRASGTLLFNVRFNGVNIFAGAALALANQTNVPWLLDLEGAYRVNSTVSALLWQGEFVSSLVVGSPAPSAGGCGVLTLPASAPANGLTFDCSADQTLDLLCAWSVASGSNSLQAHQVVVVAKS